MPITSRGSAARPIRIGFLVAGLAGLGTGFMAWQMIQRERASGIEDLDRRSAVLAHQVTQVAAEALVAPQDPAVATGLAPRLDGHRRMLGSAVFRTDGRLAASGRGVVDLQDLLAPIAAGVLSGDSETNSVVKHDDATLHVHARRLADAAGVATGSLVVVHDATYLDERLAQGMVRASFWVLLVTIGLGVVVVGLEWMTYEGPLRRLADWMHRLRMGSTSESPPRGVPVHTLFEESEHLAASFRAARSSNWVRSREVVKRDKVWTRDRLAAHATHHLAGDTLVVLSNREPYMHSRKNGKIEAIVPASGLVTALDPILQACGGLWVAHGSGEADRETSDSRGRLPVPPGNARYTLKRVWLSREDEEGYYYGFSNEGLWPLCHLAHERPVFRATDWERYEKVNRQFAAAVLDEIGPGNAMVWVQDLHLALVPRFLREARPDLRIGVFWHVPWPTAESFRTCPYGAEILKGMLGADLLGFHLQQHANNFLDSVDRVIEARLDWDQFSVELQGRRTLVRPFPISVQSWDERSVPLADGLTGQIHELRERHKITGSFVAVGVDRIDYTKGIPERFRAIARMLEKHPEHVGAFTFVQLGAPSRTHLRRYRDLVAELESLADEINWRFAKDGWKPIHLLVAHHDASTVHAFMSMATMCVVSSLHDGMNLVAKEFVSARTDGDGVLVLSPFAGAAQELTGAIIANPYDGEAFADAMHVGMTMEPAERRRRMEQMRKAVEENNVYAWAAAFLTELSQGRNPAQEPAATPAPEKRAASPALPGRAG